MTHKNLFQRLVTLLAVASLLVFGAPGHAEATSPSDIITTAITGLLNPIQIAVDGLGNRYIVNLDSTIRKVDPTGVMTTIPQSSMPSGIAADGAGNLYISDGFTNTVLKVDSNGNATTVAGTGGYGYAGDGGPATAAQLNIPGDLKVDSAGNLYIVDLFNDVIRKVNTAGIITTVAQISSVSGMAVDSAGNLYAANEDNGIIYKVNAAGIITTISGLSDLGYARLAVDSADNLYVMSSHNNNIRMVDTAGNITVVAGTGTGGYTGDGGPANLAQLYFADIHDGLGGDLAFDSAGNLYIADTLNNVIRKISIPDVPVNHPPVAYDAYFHTNKNTVLVVNHNQVPLVAIDPDYDLLQYSLVSAPTHGIVVVGGPDRFYNGTFYRLNNGFIYTPTLDYIGGDSFTYKVNDGLVDSNIATVIINVNPVNDTPTNTPMATNTSEPIATDTPLPTSTPSDTPLPTSTPTNTAVPPTNTPESTATNTSLPTATPINTAVPPTATPINTVAPPTVTSVPPTATNTPVPNQTPDCSLAYAEPALLWPPNHQMETIAIAGITDPDGQPVTVVANALFQDEPINGTGDGDTAPDATFAPLAVRAERSGNGNGRVYHITVTASDGVGGSCSVEVQVGVPHSKKKLPVDGVLHDSAPVGGASIQASEQHIFLPLIDSGAR